MRNLAITIMLFISIPTVFGQAAGWYWDFGGKLGGTNYLGDMGGKEKTRRDFVMDMKLGQTRWAAGAFGRYEFSPYFSAAVAIEHGRIQGRDDLSTNKGRVGRNLSFRNDIFELNGRGELYVYNVYDVGNRGKYRTDLRTFLFAGLGVAYSNPKARNLDYSNKYQALRPMMNEGEKYSPFQAVIPVGFGLAFTHKHRGKRHRFGFEMGWRLTFTDYLDDVSKTYVDPSQVADPSKYYFFANRTDAVPGMTPEWSANYGPPSDVTFGKRGDPSHNDNYLFMQFTYSYLIRTNGSFYRQKYGFLSNKGKGFRVTRAKF